MLLIFQRRLIIDDASKEFPVFVLLLLRPIAKLSNIDVVCFLLRGRSPAEIVAPGPKSPETYEPPHFLAEVVIPVLVFACNRPTVKRNLDQLIKLRPSKEQFPIIVTQDCGHAETARVIQSYGDQVVHIKQPDLTSIDLPYKERRFQGYYKIARHYKWALNQVFHEFNHDIVLIVEDDLDVSPDFFEYFLGLYTVLISDPTLWCVSAWNDNGKETRIGPEADRLYRSDFFPGLGWMVEKKIWLELEPKWPKTFWDDWMRQPAQRQNRSCIRPEICRTKTFGKKGVSNGLYYEQHLKYIKLNDKFVPFTKMDLSVLKKDRYDEQFVKEVYGCPLLTVDQVKKNHKAEAKKVRVEYTTKKNFESTAKALGIMADLKSGVPRAGYRGVVSFYYNGRRVFLSPPGDWTKYDPTWN